MDKNNVMMIIIIALLVILLGAIGFVGYTVLTNAGDDKTVEQTQTGDRSKLTMDQKTLVAFSESSDAIKATFREPNDKTGILTFNISIALDNSNDKLTDQIAALAASITANKPVVLSYVSEIVYSHPVSDFTDSSTIISILSEEILQKLQTEFASQYIYEVNITGYVYMIN